MKALLLTIGFACLSVQAQIPSNGLIAYFPFKGNANDSSINKTHGTNNNATLTTDRFGHANSAYYFNGTNAYIQFPSTNVQTKRYTYSLWASLSSKPSSGNYTFALNIGSTGGDQNVNTCNDYSVYDGWIGGGYTGTSSTMVVNQHEDHSINEWHHIVSVRDSNFMLLYIDGVLVDSTGTSNNTDPYYGYGSVKAMIGIRNDLTKPFHGKIDEVCIYDRALSKSEVDQLYDVQNTSIADITTTQQQDFLIYPNGKGSIFNIDLKNVNGDLGRMVVKITNMNGQEVFLNTFTPDQLQITVDCGLTTGQYLVALYDEKNRFIGCKKLLILE